MKIQVGRDSGTGGLVLKKDGQPVWYGQADNVPTTICQEHCLLEINDEDIRITNLDMNNDTFVNGLSVQTKQITRGDQISLGKDRYPLDWRIIDKVAPPAVDIRSLETVWSSYDGHRMDQQIADRRFASLRSATGIITMLAIALSMMTGRQSLGYVVLYAVAILVSFAFTIKAYRDASTVPQKMKELERQFQKDYTCPHCHCFLGNTPYQILTQKSSCPYCKIKFIH